MKARRERDLGTHILEEVIDSADVDLDAGTFVLDGSTKNFLRAENLGDGTFLVGYRSKHRTMKHQDHPGKIEDGNPDGWR